MQLGPTHLEEAGVFGTVGIVGAVVRCSLGRLGLDQSPATDGGVIRQRLKPEVPELLCDLPYHRAPVLMERAQVLEDLLESIPGDLVALSVYGHSPAPPAATGSSLNNMSVSR